MVATTATRGIAAVRDAAERSTFGEELFERVSEQLRKVVPYDGSLWFAADPETVMPSAPVRVENVAAGHCETYWEREHVVEDVLLFRDVARTETGMGTLTQATGGHWNRSARSREFLAPQGFGDELRAAVRVGNTTWGMLSLFRDERRGDFTKQEQDLVSAVIPSVAQALRMMAISGDVCAGLDVPGTILVGTDGRAISQDAAAEYWLTQLAGHAPAGTWLHELSKSADRLSPLLSPLAAAIARARMIAEGRERLPASTRIRARSGRWLMVQASALQQADGTPGPIAVSIGPAKSAQIAPIIVEAYGLTQREQEITQAISRGLSNAEIAVQLFLSPFTVRDHIKAIFTKVGVNSRGELVAKLFADHYSRPMHASGYDVHFDV